MDTRNCGLKTLQWRHNERNGVSMVLLNRLFMHKSKKTSRLRVSGICEGNSPLVGEFPSQRASNAENASIWWRLMKGVQRAVGPCSPNIGIQIYMYISNGSYEQFLSDKTHQIIGHWCIVAFHSLMWNIHNSLRATFGFLSNAWWPHYTVAYPKCEAIAAIVTGVLGSNSAELPILTGSKMLLMCTIVY